MTFTKEVHPYYQSSEFGHFYNCKLYSLYDGHNIVGQLIMSGSEAIISSKDAKLKIDIIDHLLTPKEYIISELKSKAKIGFYFFSIWEIAWKEIGSLTLNNEKFVCNIEIPDIRHRILDKSTWGHHKISMKSNLTEIVYSIKVETGWLGLKNSEFSDANGKVTSDHPEISMILAGLVFFERMFSVNNESA